MTRFLIIASFATVAAMLSGWAHASEPARKCTIVSQANGTTVIKCPTVSGGAL